MFHKFQQKTNGRVPEIHAASISISSKENKKAIIISDFLQESIMTSSGTMET